MSTPTRDQGIFDVNIGADVNEGQQDLYLAEPILVHDVHVEAMDSAPINTPSSVAGTPTKAAPKKRAPKANQDGTPKKSTSRKKKATASAEDTALNGEQGESVGDNVKPTPKKRATPSKSAKAKVVKKEAVSNLLITDDQSDLGHGFQESLSQSEETLDLIEALDVHMTTPTPTSGAKRGARSFNGDDDTPTKKPKIKDDGVAPQLDAALIAKLPEDDQLMFQMRQQNKAWGAIEAALTSKTGKAYAPSTLRKRHARLLNDVFEWKQVDIKNMFTAVTQVSDDADAAVKKAQEDAEHAVKRAQAEKWAIVSSKMQGLGSAKYPPAAIEKKFKQVEKEDPITEDDAVDTSSHQADDTNVTQDLKDLEV